MKFTDLLEATDNLPHHTELVNKIKVAVEEGKWDWNSKVPTAFVLDELGVSLAELTDFCKCHDFDADHLSIGFSGNEDDEVSFGRDPKTMRDSDGNYYNKPITTGEISDEIHGDL